MRSNLRFAVLIGMVLSAVVGAQSTPRPPNVLFIAVDDLNDWVGCLGDGHPNSKTPNIDSLAAKGALFTNAHCQAPVCGPSRASLWTGLLPSTTGIYGQVSSPRLAEHPRVRDNPTPYLSSYLARHGYETLAVGKLFHSDGGKDAFERYGGKLGGWGPKPKTRLAYTPPGGKGTQTDWGAFPDVDTKMADHKVADWAIERLGEERDAPFFLAVGFWRPHVPWYAPREWFDLHPIDGVSNPPILDADWDDIPDISKAIHAMPMMPQLEWMRQQDRMRAATQAYLACTTFVDAQIGRVLDALRNSRHADDTIVVLWSDHGYHLGEKHRWAKHSLWEEATRVPLVIAGPGLPRGRRVDDAVGLIDLYPTVLQLAGLPANDNIDGRSLAPLLADPATRSTEPRVAITTYGWGNHAVRDARYRYIRYEDGTEELYDHDADPHEWNNLASSDDHREVLDRLREDLPTTNHSWFEHSNMSMPYFVDNKRRHGAPAPWQMHVIDPATETRMGADGVRVGDADGDGRPDIVTGWEQGNAVRVCLNPGASAVKRPWPSVTVGTVERAEDAVFVDLDADGNLDVVSCTEGETRTVYVHWAPHPDACLDADAWQTEAIPVTTNRQSWMFALPMQVDGRNGTDLIVGSKGRHGSVGWLRSPEDPRDLGSWTFHEITAAGWIMTLRSTGEGTELAPVYVTDRKGERRGVYRLVPSRVRSGTVAWTREDVGGQAHELMFMDLWPDSKAPLVATRNGVLLDLASGAPTTIPNPFGVAFGKAVRIGDIDGDRVLDIVHTANVGEESQRRAVTWMKRVDGRWQTHDIGGAPGSKFDLIELLDLDADGDLDVITCEEGAGPGGGLGVIWYENPSA